MKIRRWKSVLMSITLYAAMRRDVTIRWFGALLTGAFLLLIYTLARDARTGPWLAPAMLPPSACGWFTGPLAVPTYPGSWLIHTTSPEEYWDDSETGKEGKKGCLLVTTASPSEIQAFYDEQMPLVGWKVCPEYRGPVKWIWPCTTHTGFEASMHLKIEEPRDGQTRYSLEGYGENLSVPGG